MPLGLSVQGLLHAQARPAKPAAVPAKDPRLACYASVPAAVSPDFAKLLSEEGERILFCGRPIEVRQITRWS